MSNNAKGWYVTKRVEGFPEMRTLQPVKWDMDAEHQATLAYYQLHPEARGRKCETVSLEPVRSDG